MTLHEIIQKNMEEFEKEFNRYPSINMTPEVGKSSLLMDLEDFLLSSQLSIIQAIDEWAEKNKKPIYRNATNAKDKMIFDHSCAYNAALSDLRSFLEEAKTKEIIN